MQVLPRGLGGQSFDQCGYARLPVPNDIVHGDSTGGCRCNVWATAPPPPVSGVHWSSGVGEIIEPLTVVLGEPLGSRMGYGGGRQPAERCWSHDFESSNSGTIRDIVASDVVGNDNSIGVDHVVFPVEEMEKLSMIPRAQRAAKYMTAMGLRRPPSGPGAPGPLPASTCPSCMKCEYCFGRREPSTQ